MFLVIYEYLICENSSSWTPITYAFICIKLCFSEVYLNNQNTYLHNLTVPSVHVQWRFVVIINFFPLETGVSSSLPLPTWLRSYLLRLQMKRLRAIPRPLPGCATSAPTQGSVLRRALHLVYSSAVTILKFLIIY